MTPQELNRDVKRLARQELKLCSMANEMPNEEYYCEAEKIKKEAKRLYLADPDFSYMSKKSILIMLRINTRYRFEALHHFGLRLNIEKLL